MQNIYPILSHDRSLLIKIGGLDAAKIPTMNNPLKTMVGSWLYQAPEVYGGDEYTNAVDIWSLGCLFFRLWTGDPLFPDRKTLFSYIFCPQDSPKALGEGIKDKAARELITGMFQLDPNDRPSAKVALSHEWFQNPSEMETQEVTLGLYSHFVDLLESGKIPRAVEPVEDFFRTNVPSSGKAISITHLS